MMKRVAKYLRKSRADVEAEKLGQYETLATHDSMLTRLAEHQDLKVIKSYKELVSGELISERAEMQLLLQDVLENKYDGVMVVDVDRLGRGNAKDQGTIIDIFKYSKTLIITPSKTYDPNNPQDEEFLEMGQYMGRKELKITNRRFKTGRLEAVTVGNYLGSRPPFGYDIWKRGRKDRTLKPNEYSDYVKMIFELYSNNVSCYEISRKLNALGVPTHHGSNGWKVTTLKGILKNDVYIGKIHWEKKKYFNEFDGLNLVKVLKVTDDFKVFDGKHEAIIEEDLFNKVQNMLKTSSPVNRKKMVNPLAGILRCSKCNHMMVYHKGYPKQGKKPRINHAFHIETCKTKSVCFHVVYDKVINMLNNKIEDFKTTIEESENGNEQIKYEKLKNTLENELKKLKIRKDGLFEKYEDGDYTKAEFLERKEIYIAKIENVEKELIMLSPPKIDEYKEQIIKFSKVVKSLKDNKIPIVEKNNLLKSIIETIYYTNDIDINLSVTFKV